VAAGCLQIEHHARKLRRRDLRALAKLARREVLAEHAPQIAPTEKDRARPIPGPQAILLAEMRKRARHPRLPPALAHADLVVEPVNLAIARTNATRPQRFHSLVGPLLEKSLLECFDVSRHKILPRQHKSSAAVQFRGHASREWKRTFMAELVRALVDLMRR